MDVPKEFIQWPEWRQDRDEEQLKEARQKAVKDMEVHGFHVPEEFTCDDCNIRGFCSLAYDIYNTGGDCLLEH